MKKFVYILSFFILNQLHQSYIHSAYVPIDYPGLEPRTTQPQLRIPIEQRKPIQNTTYPSSLWQQFSNWLNTSISKFQKAYELNKSRQIYLMTPPEEEEATIKKEYEVARSQKEKEIEKLKNKSEDIYNQQEEIKIKLKQIDTNIAQENEKLWKIDINKRDTDEYHRLKKLKNELLDEYFKLRDQNTEIRAKKYKLADDQKRIEKEHNQQLAEIKKSRTLEKRIVNPTREAQEEFTKAIEGNIPIDYPVKPSSYLDQLKQKWQEIKQRPIEPTTAAEKALSEAIDSQDYVRANPDIVDKARQQLRQRWEQSKWRQWFGGRKK